MSFLSAEWRKLAIANYEVDPVILKPYLPPKTEPDIWQDTCYISLVGFMFLNTKLLGLPIPFHRNFEEVNLRFYVKHLDGQSWKRGVVFIKEIVPKPALTFVANIIYKEHYHTMKMDHSWSEHQNKRTVKYFWASHRTINSFEVIAELDSVEIAPDSETEFITEHYWGYTKANERESFEYEVTHPKWRAYNVLKHDIQVDFASVYGKSFDFLNNLEPKSVMLAEGSEITVENKRKI
tara:strand:- start:616 stop:1323 length:708 start_codon:yes stop_codon:yes gene_type:complete